MGPTVGEHLSCTRRTIFHSTLSVYFSISLKPAVPCTAKLKVRVGGGFGCCGKSSQGIYGNMLRHDSALCSTAPARLHSVYGAYCGTLALRCFDCLNASLPWLCSTLSWSSLGFTLFLVFFHQVLFWLLCNDSTPSRCLVLYSTLASAPPGRDADSQAGIINFTQKKSHGPRLPAVLNFSPLPAPSRQIYTCLLALSSASRAPMSNSLPSRARHRVYVFHFAVIVCASSG